MAAAAPTPEAAAAAAAAQAAAAAAASTQQLQSNIQAAGGAVLPPKGRMAPSNSHRTFRSRMEIECFMEPDKVEDKQAALIEGLDELLFRYLDDHQAILMSYNLLEVELHKTFLHPEPPPMLTVRAVADVVTFEPTPGDIICGVVTKLAPSSITLVAAGCVSVEITRPFIPEGWEFNTQRCCWAAEGVDLTRAVSLGDLMTCMAMTYPRALDPDEEEVLFNLQGSLLLQHMGLCAWQWPRQQRLRQLRAATHGQGEYGPEQEAHWQKQQQQLQRCKLTRKQLVPLEQLKQQLAADSDSGSSGSDGSDDEEETEEGDDALQGGEGQADAGGGQQQQQPASPQPSQAQQQQAAKKKDKRGREDAGVVQHKKKQKQHQPPAQPQPGKHKELKDKTKKDKKPSLG